MDNSGDFFTENAPAFPSDSPICQTDCTYDMMLEFNRKGVLSPKQYRQMRVRRILSLVVLLLSVPLILWLFSSEKTFSTGKLILCSDAFLILILGLEFLTLYVIVPRQLKKSPLIGSRIEYVFEEDVFRAEVQSASTESHETVRYDGLVKVTETEHLILLFTQPNVAHIVDKCGFTQGSPDDLKRILTATIPQDKLHFLK